MTLRKMPSPWFRAQAREYPVSIIWERERHRGAPLTEGERSLGWMVLPPFQRPAVWSEAQQARFIESLWNHLPIGAYVVNRSEDYNSPFDCWLLDGQQRVTAVLAYVVDAFQVYGHRWSDLSVPERRSFENRTFTCLETDLDDLALLEDVYDRLAYGGTPHEPK